MLFNSAGFFVFIIVVFWLYWFVAGKSLKLQNMLLLASSYFFYSFWDWRFLFLLVFSTLLDYFTGLKIEESEKPSARRFWLFLSVIVNLGFLAFFKYYNFFAQSFAEMLGKFGLEPNFTLLNVILPVGISFYTFHGLSYVFDINNRKIVACRNFVDYSLFVSFFPLLVAGPIERATHLLPQVSAPRTFKRSNAIDGLKQFLWGLFKKVVIADNCAEYVNTVFANSGEHHASSLVLAAILFAFQIYGDFSGYSDMALGTARLLGFELLQNFSYPYFSRDIAEFWRRWHISLSSWFKDYLYFPLGGSRGGIWMRIRNTFIIFVVSGFWHGANWTFIVWGALNALFILPLVLSKSNRNNIDIVAKGKTLPSIKELFQILITFSLTVFAWIFFRSESISQAVTYIGQIFSKSLLKIPDVLPVGILFLMVPFFILMEWKGREYKYALANFGLNWPRPVRWSFYALIIFSIGMYMHTKETSFIYFQF